MSLKKDNTYYKIHRDQLHYGEYVAPHSYIHTNKEDFKKKRNSQDQKITLREDKSKKLFGIKYIPFIY